MQQKTLDFNSFLDAVHQPDSVELKYVVPVVLALLVHAGVQIKEPSSPPFVWSWIAVSAFLTYFIRNKWNVDLSSAAKTVFQMNCIWVITICYSMALYRTAFHRLRKFPGPMWMSLSKWFMVSVDLKGQRPYKFQKLHEKYGDVIRIGPRELSVNDPAALTTIYGGTGVSMKATRGPFYDFTVESTKARSRNLQSTPTMSDHAARRKVWDAAFSIKAVKGYEENIIKNTNLLISQIDKAGSDGSSVDLGQWCSWYGFDVMGELGFGRGFGMLKAAKTAHAIELLESGVILIMATGNIPYIMALVRNLPNPIRVFEDWIRQTMEYRVKEGNKGVVEADVFSHLLGEHKARGQVQSMNSLSADAGLLIVAGSDTSSNAMALTLFNMIAHQEYYKKVQEEVEKVFGKELAEDLDRLNKECPLLNACINETLRLWPPVASGLQRVTPAEGMTLPSGHYIPGNVVISTQTYTMHRDARNFSKPDDFIPERWLNEPKEGEVFNMKAFSAFGYGPTGCIGKNVAYHEMRVIVARFVQTFDAQFTKGFDVDLFKSHIKDCFVMVKDPITINVKTRSPDFAMAH
jgi:cytochrome P450